MKTTRLTRSSQDTATSLRARVHKLTPYDAHTALMRLVTAAPAVAFAAVVPGLYFYLPSYGSGQHVLRVLKTTPAGRKIVASFLRKTEDSGPVDLFAGSYGGKFHPIDEATVDLLRMEHRELVAAAVQAGELIPVAVRREYPSLFVTIPAEFSEDDVHKALGVSMWGKRITGPETLKEAIASVHESISAHDRSAALLITYGARGQAESDKARASLLDRLAFYLWLEPLVATGGVFHVEAVAREEVAA
jgi:hypothetical protein